MSVDNSSHDVNLRKASLGGEVGRHLHRSAAELAHAQRGLVLVQQLPGRHLGRPLLGIAERKVDDIAICRNISKELTFNMKRVNTFQRAHGELVLLPDIDDLV